MGNSMKFYIILAFIMFFIYKWVIDYMVISYLKKYHAEDRLLNTSVKKKIRNIWRLAVGKDYWLIRGCYPMIIGRKTLFCIFRYSLRVESILILTLLLLFLFGFIMLGIASMIKFGG